MAVTILQQPTSPNATVAELLYSVSSSNALQPQFSYVCDVYLSGSNEFVTRLTQVPNPTGNATFNLKEVTKSQLEYKDYKKQQPGVGNVVTSSFANFFLTENYFDFTSSRKYTIEFGEAYGTSISSSVTLYPNLTDTQLTVFPGVWNANDPNDPLFNTNNALSPFQVLNYPFNYNFPSSSLVFTDIQPDNADHQLTDDPYQLDRGRSVYKRPTFAGDDILRTIGKDDYMTRSFIVGSAGASAVFPNGLSMRAFSGSVFYDAVFFQDDTVGENYNNGLTVNYGIGPANIKEFADSGKIGSDNPSIQAIASGSFTYYTATAGGNGLLLLNESLAFGRSLLSIPPLNFPGLRVFYEITSGTEKLRFAFINRYGVWDYFNCYGVLKRNTALEKDMVNLPRVNYSTGTSPFDPTSRGLQDYFTDFTDNYSIVTQPLDQYQAQWLGQLFDSPRVSVQQGSEFIPILINNPQYQQNLNSARNKDFTYTIEFLPAKGREIYSSQVACELS